MSIDSKIVEIIKKKIEEDYSEHVAMLVKYATKHNVKDERLGTQLYYIPKTEYGKSLGVQFIACDVSYDLFPISWDRLVANAAMDSPQGYMLLDTEILYCSDESARERFEKLKNSLRVVLSGEYDDALLNKSYEYFNETYIFLFNMETYRDDLESVRIEGGKLLKNVANAVGFANSEYYKNCNGSIIEDSMELENTPKDYSALVDQIIFGKTPEGILKASTAMIKNTREFLLDKKKSMKSDELFETIFTGYHEELKKSIDKCRIAMEGLDYYKVYELVTFMQEETAQFMAKSEEGIWYDSRNAFQEFGVHFINEVGVGILEAISEKNANMVIDGLDKLENKMIEFVNKNGVSICEFNSVEEFEKYFTAK